MAPDGVVGPDLAVHGILVQSPLPEGLDELIPGATGGAFTAAKRTYEAQIAKLNGRPKARRELIHSFLDSLFVFRLRVRLLRIRVPIDYCSNPTVLVAKGDFIERYLGVYTQFAAIHQRGIEDNAGEPRGKAGSALE